MGKTTATGKDDRQLMGQAPGVPLMRITDVRKAFAGTQALDGVSFDLLKGTFHALVGGNGSGKSTVIKILAGVYEADAGEVSFPDRTISLPSYTASDAREQGLRFVHQQPSTFPELTVAENIAIGYGFGRTGPLGRIHWRSLRNHTKELLDRFQIDARPGQQLGSLGPASQTMVAIARALQDLDADRTENAVLVLDEPTASLPRREVNTLLSALDGYAKAGQTILYVTHRLEEVVQLADRVTVFRDGHVAGNAARGQFDHDSLVELIMGYKVQDVLKSPRHRARADAKPMLALSDLQGGPIQGASLKAYQGEIVGLAGLLGSGRSSLAKMIFGALPFDAGTIEVSGRRLTPKAPRDSIAAGVAYVPENRLSEAAFLGLNIKENLGIVSTGDYFERGRLRHARERRDAEALAKAYMVRAESLDAPFTSMSGGNQQKVILARWLRTNPKVLLLDEPTQGIDIGTRAEIWRLVRAAVDAGATALVISSDMEELPKVCDRVLVLGHGVIVEELEGAEVSEQNLDRLLLGGGAHE